MMTFRPVPTLDASLIYGTWSGWILACTQWLDTNLGVSEWSLRHVAVLTAIILGAIRVFTAKQKLGIDLYALLHALVTGYGSVACVWLNVYAAESLTGTPEPLRSILCQGPLTGLHRILPAITMGYGVFDIIEGIEHGIDFFMHGIATFTVMAYFCEFDVAEILMPMLLMEVSTVNLSLVKASFLSEGALAFNMGVFVVTFFLFRLFICPYLWLGILSAAWEHRDNPISQACMPWHFKYAILCFGMFFNCLNSFWAYKIVLKVKRKLSGVEKVKQNNDLKNK